MQRHLAQSGANIAYITTAIAGASLRKGRYSWETAVVALVVRRGAARYERHGAVETGDNIETNQCVPREKVSLGQYSE